MNFRPLFSLFSSDLAIDLGTANTLVYAKGRGVVVNGRLQTSDPDIHAIGDQRFGMLTRIVNDVGAEISRRPCPQPCA